MFLTPWLTAPIRYASECSRDSSAVGNVCVPSLFFSLWINILLLVGDGTVAEGSRIKGRRRGTRKRDRPREPSFKEPVRARATETSLSVALENHLKPFRVYFGPR